MKVMLLILTLLAIAGCEVSESKAASDNDYGYTTITYDGCEYVEYFSQSHAVLSHKGNCKNCREFYKQLFKGQQ